jgi:predicted MFS family arabinose efflux permease
VTSRWLVIIIGFGLFAGNLETLALSPLLAPIANDIGSTVPLVGQSAMAAMLCGAIGGLFLGPLADHYGFRRLLLMGAVLAVLSGVGTALAFNLWSLIGARIAAGLASGILMGIGMSVINTEFTGDARRSAIAWLSSAGALVPLLGVPALAVLADFWTWRAGFFLMALLAVGLIVAYARMTLPAPPAPAERLRLSRVMGTYREVLADARMAFLQLGTVVWSVAVFGTGTYFGAYLLSVVGASLSTVGLLYTWAGIWTLLGTRCVSWLAKLISPRTLLIPVATVMGLTTYVFFTQVTTVLAVLVVTALFNFVNGLGLPLMTIIISEAAKTAHGTVMMLRHVALQVGSGMGAGLGGLLIWLGGYSALAVGLTLSVAVALALIVWGGRGMR